MKDFKKVTNLISRAMIKDRMRFKRQLRDIGKMHSDSDSKRLAKEKRMDRLMDQIQRSIARTRQRESNHPQKISFDPKLPIVGRKNEIIQAIKENRVVIISGETGSGKTTQIPKFCIKAGLGRAGMIGCTQPRRIAAINVARRIAQELGQTLGQAVGYKIRFDDKTSPDASIKLMTDGILLAETQTDPFLNDYDTLIIDEAHERSLNIDFTLGILRRLVKKRKDLKLIITSATIDTQKFSSAFDDAPIIEVSGRTYPVETIYSPIIGNDENKAAIEDQGYVEAAANAVHRLVSQSRTGDILVFMPSEQDIGDTMELIRGRQIPGIVVLPLFARLSAKEQSKIFTTGAGRKVIVSTNVAETSLTIPGIKYVVDTGLARIPHYSPRTRTTALPVSPISQSSANQRMGRCGRVENGICIRLYDEDDFGARPFFTAPEILRSNLAEVILRMISLRLGDVSSFPFIDPPNPKSIKDGFDTLVELGAIRAKTAKNGKKSYALTPMGKIMAKLPVDPKLARILIEANEKGCLNEAAIITTALAISDPRQRPADKTQAADQQHAAFKDPASDFITLLNIWNAYREAEKNLKSRSKLIQFCQKHFLSFKRIREWTDIHRQIIRLMKENDLVSDNRIEPVTGTRNLKSKEFEVGGPLYIALHQSLLSGYLSHIAHKKEKNIFSAAKGQQAMIFPGSGLFNAAGNWIVAAEYVKTSQLFARTVANIDPAWLEPIGKALCTHSYSDPHWEKKSGQVVVTEQVSLFGLIIVAGRKTAYGRINPEEAGSIFIRSALVEGDMDHRFEFYDHNRKLIRELATLEDKTRSKDILASEEDMFDFYQSKLPKPFYDIRSFARFIKDQDSQDFLKMTLEDLEKSRVDEDHLAAFPDTLAMPGGRFKLEYAFEPGSKKDGVTIAVPKNASAQVSKHKIDRLVPGLFEEKITALIKNLPKNYRKRLVPVSQKAAIISRELPNEDRPLFSLLSEFIKNRFNIVIPAGQWSEDQLPEHLRMRISIRDDKGRELKAVRDKSVLSHFSTDAAASGTDLFDRARQKHEKTGIKTWDFGDLDDHLALKDETGFTQKAYLRLSCEPGESKPPQLALRLFRSENQARAAHVKAIKQLYLLIYADDFKALKKDINRSGALKKIAPSFSGQTKFQADIFDLVTEHIFAVPVLTQNAFDDLARQQIPRLYQTGQDMIQSVIRVGEAYQACFELIQKLSFAHQAKAKTFELLTSLFNELKNLVPQNFTHLYTIERIKQLPRFIDGIAFRASKTIENPLKEETRAKQVHIYTRQLESVLSSLTKETSGEKTKAVEDFYWLLEEYKISIFAQHLKTAVKVSPKRLDKAMTKLSTMI